MKKLFLLLAFVSCCKISSAQWQQLNGPEGGMVNCLLNYKGMLFAGTYDGVFVSKDRGATWTQKDNDLDQTQWGTWVESFGIMGNKVFAGTEGGVFVTTDYGDSWTLINDSLTFYTGVTCLVANGGLLLQGTLSNGIFMSSDSGVTWKNILEGGPLEGIQMIFAIGNKMMASYSNSKGYLTSSDTGKTWVETTSPLYRRSINKMAFNNNILYAATDTGLYSSNDTGSTWVLSGNKVYSNNLIFYKNYIYADRYFSNDSGRNWNPVTNLNTNFYCSCLLGDTLFVGTYGGMFWTDDNTVSWHSDNTGLNNTDVKALAVGDKGIILSNDSGVFISKDDGNTWTLVNKSVRNNSFKQLLVNEDNTFAIGRYDGLTYLSKDQGVTFNLVRNGTDTIFGSLIAQNKSNLYVTSSEYNSDSGYSLPRVYLSTDNGNSWKRFDKGLPKVASFYQVYNIDQFAFAGDTIFATYDGGLYYSIDTSANWIQIDTSFHYSFYHITISGNNFLCFNGTDDFVFSKDRGVTWKESYYDFNRNDIYNLIELNDTFYASTLYGGSYLLPDTSLQWSPCLPLNFAEMLYATYNGSIYAGGWFSGVWKHYSSPAVANAIPVIKIEASFLLYPNPSENTVTIAIGSGNASSVLSIYGPLGNLLREQTITAPSAVIDIQALPQGIYFACISGKDGFMEIKKFVKQ